MLLLSHLFFIPIPSSVSNHSSVFCLPLHPIIHIIPNTCLLHTTTPLCLTATSCFGFCFFDYYELLFFFSLSISCILFSQCHVIPLTLTILIMFSMDYFFSTYHLPNLLVPPIYQFLPFFSSMLWPSCYTHTNIHTYTYMYI